MIAETRRKPSAPMAMRVATRRSMSFAKRFRVAKAEAGGYSTAARKESLSTVRSQRARFSYSMAKMKSSAPTMHSVLEREAV